VDDLQTALQRTIKRLQDMAEDGYAPSFFDYNHTAKFHGCYRISSFARHGMTYSQICAMAGLMNRASGPRKGTKPPDPNNAPKEVEAEVVEMLSARQKWMAALKEFPLQAIPTRTEVFLCQVKGTTYQVTRQYASLK
jgi:hypothetical protein